MASLYARGRFHCQHIHDDAAHETQPLAATGMSVHRCCAFCSRGHGHSAAATVRGWPVPQVRCRLQRAADVPPFVDPPVPGIPTTAVGLGTLRRSRCVVCGTGGRTCGAAWGASTARCRARLSVLTARGRCIRGEVIGGAFLRPDNGDISGTARFLDKRRTQVERAQAGASVVQGPGAKLTRGRQSDQHSIGQTTTPLCTFWDVARQRMYSRSFGPPYAKGRTQEHRMGRRRGAKNGFEKASLAPAKSEEIAKLT